jgi:hypothetical protein
LLTSWGAGGWDDLEMTTQLNEHLAFAEDAKRAAEGFLPRVEVEQARPSESLVTKRLPKSA